MLDQKVLNWFLVKVQWEVFVVEVVVDKKQLLWWLKRVLVEVIK